jgi:hypothetical protein
MSTQREQHTDQARATLETAIDFGLDQAEILDAMVCVWHDVGTDVDAALEDLAATLAVRILERERSGAG